MSLYRKSKPSNIDTNALSTQLHDLQRQYDALLVREKRAERHLDRSENKYETAKRLLERVLYGKGMTEGDKLKIGDALRKLDRRGSHEVESDVDRGRAMSIITVGDEDEDGHNDKMKLGSDPLDYDPLGYYDPLSANVVNHDRFVLSFPTHSHPTITLTNPPPTE